MLVQVLKKMFDMTNYKSAAYSVGNFWAMKAVMHYRDPRRRSWYEDSVEPDEEFLTDIKQVASQSMLLRLVMTGGEVPAAVRMLTSVSRGPDTVTVGDWVVVQQGETRYAGRVKGMLQAVITQELRVVRVVRLLLAHVTACSEGALNELWSEMAPHTSVSVAKFEYVHVTVVRSICVDQRRKYMF